jgi:iron(III) transport system ATP-binding protein
MNGKGDRIRSMLKVTNLTKYYETNAGIISGVTDVSFAVPEGQIVTLLGPSGCGKTTILRCVAGLERLDAGEIVLNGHIVSKRIGRIHVQSSKRPIAMMFQSYAIWPHMNVWANVAYPLQYGPEQITKSTLGERVSEALGLVKIRELADRPIFSLSGGQQQRVALARALVRRPKLLLLDEPLSNLDAQLREEMRSEFRDLFNRLGITVLYVTHDLNEALMLSDQLLIVDQGRVIQAGTPVEIYNEPKNQFIAQFMGAGEVFDGTIAAMSGHDLTIDIGLGIIRTRPSNHDFRISERVQVAIRPEELKLGSRKFNNKDVIIEVSIESAAFLGLYWEYRVNTNSGRTLIVRSPSSDDPLPVGASTVLRIPGQRCMVLPMGVE